MASLLPLAGPPLREIVRLVCAQKGWDTDHQRFNQELRLKISRALDRKKLKGFVERIGEDAVGVWRLVKLFQAQKGSKLKRLVA